VRSVIDPLFSLAHSIHANKGVFALLLGSGISRSAGIPTGWEVTLDLAGRVAAMTGEDPGEDVEAWYLAKYGEEPNYSKLLHALARSPAERRRLLHAYFEPTPEEREQGIKLPSPAHRSIAKLVASGAVRVILTTNFDRLMELALQDEGIVPTVISTGDAVVGAAPLVHQTCVVVKLHGDYLDDRIKNTEEELSKFDKRMEKYLDRILDEFGMIYCGWSAEWDPALRSAVERCKSHRYTSYWTCTRPPGAKAADLVRLRRAEVVEIKDADTFFANLEDKVTSLQDLDRPAPLSVAAAVASLKRYVVEPKHRIRLHDLLVDEASRVAQVLKPALPGAFHVANPAEEARRRGRICEAATEILRHSFFHAALWGAPTEYLTKALSMLLRFESTGGLTNLLDIRRYPASLLMYSAGLGALAAGEFRLLNSLLTVTFHEQSRDRVGFRQLAAVSFGQTGVIGPNLEGRHTPVSDFYLEVMRPMMAGVVSDPETTFDQLEVLIALVYLDASSDLASERWLPWGRFAWLGRSFDEMPALTFVEHAKNAGANWPPLAAGMFGGSARRFQEVADAFARIMAAAASHFF
jgi:hypothetical protein